MENNSKNFFLRWILFVKERFPILSHVTLILFVFAANGLVALESLYLNLLVGRREILGLIVVVLLFFHLRIFDEVKDYDTDVIVHPERPLARGLISLKEARIVAFSIIVIELVLSLFISRSALIGIVCAILYSLLMYKEFFMKDWLRKRLIPYALTHSVISGIIPLFIFSCVTGIYLWKITGIFGLFVIVNVLLSNVFEFSRKTFAESEEREKRDSYSKTLGLRRAIFIVLFIQTLSLVLCVSIGSLLLMETLFFMSIGILFVITLLVSLFFLSSKRVFWARIFRSVGSLFILLLNGIIIAGILWMV
jgi:4-hydroxybenzoate polyprenyltransferase